MEDKKWPLVIMTLGCQASVGLLLLHLTLKSLLNATYPDLLVEVICLGVAGLSAMTASLHLGCPGNAINTVRNIASSWFSREAFFMGLFLGSLTIQIGGRLRGFHLYLEIPALVAGLSLVYAMVKVYDLKAVTTWHGKAVIKDFFMSALLLGSILYSLILIWQTGKPNIPLGFAGLLLMMRLYQFRGKNKIFFIAITAVLSWVVALAALPGIFLLFCLVLTAAFEYQSRTDFYHSYQREGV